MNITAHLEALAAQPRQWRVATRFSDGTWRFHDTHSEDGAENFAIGERRNIGREVISRASGKTIHATSVTVAKIA